MIIGDIYNINNISYFTYKSNISNIIYRDIHLNLEQNSKYILDLLAKELNIKVYKFKKYEIIYELNQRKTINNNQIIFQ